MTIDIGQVAYEGYRVASDYKSLVSGEPLPTWHEQAPEIREAWRAAADAVLTFTTLAPVSTPEGSGERNQP